ncbi:hypothetical protein GCM10009630_32850 [Kribbella jejuensis]
MLAHAEREWVAGWVPEGDPAPAWWIGWLEDDRASSQFVPRAQQTDDLRSKETNPQTATASPG